MRYMINLSYVYIKSKKEENLCVQTHLLSSLKFKPRLVLLLDFGRGLNSMSIRPAPKKDEKKKKENRKKW